GDPVGPMENAAGDELIGHRRIVIVVSDRLAVGMADVAEVFVDLRARRRDLLIMRDGVMIDGAGSGLGVGARNVDQGRSGSGDALTFMFEAGEGLGGFFAAVDRYAPRVRAAAILRRRQIGD